MFGKSSGLTTHPGVEIIKTYSSFIVMRMVVNAQLF